MKTVNLSDANWKALTYIKLNMGFVNMDSVVTYLLSASKSK